MFVLSKKNLMRRIVIALVLLPLIGLSQTKREEVTLEAVHGSGKFYPSSVWNIRHMSDGKHYTVNSGGSIIQYSYEEEGAKDVLFDAAKASELGIEKDMRSYEISGSGRFMLIETDRESIYRYSKRSVYYLYDSKENIARVLCGGERIFYPTISPIEKYVAYVFGNNLYYENIAGDERVQITTDGKENKILNGRTDWVYEEEFALVKGFEWSPDGKKIGFLRFDESEVKQYQIPVYTGNAYPNMYTYKYPKTGEDNSLVTAHIYRLADKKTVKADIETGVDIYLPRIKWANANLLSVQRMNRWQNELDLLLVNPGDGSVKKIWSDKSSTYIDVTDDLTFVDGKTFIISSERSGFNHLYHFNLEGKLIRQLTEGDYDVTSFLGFDEDEKRLYYEAAKASPLTRQLFSVKLNGRGQKQLSPDSKSSDGDFSAGFDYYIQSSSDINVAPVIDIRNNKGKLVRTLVDNKEFNEMWSDVGMLPMEFFTIKAADGETELNGWEIKPAGFDPSNKYPLLMFVYGGPGSQTVTNSWYTRNKAWFQYLALNGYYVISVDNRGTGARGANFKKMTYQNLGDLETQDQLAVAEQMAAKPFIDEDRIGMFGWSYGGYMTSLCLAKSELLKVGVAVAPVTDWRFYDNIYTERFMRRPIDNEEGYNKSSVLEYADGFRGKDYLLIHGSFDDNVHPQNAFELMKLLQLSNIPFDSEIYINKNHGIYGGFIRLHLFQRITEYLDEHLMGE